MPLDSVPWFVGGGAQHSPEVARTLAFAATGGKRGIISPTDLKVTPTAVPGNNVQVSVGSAVIPSRNATGLNQSYIARMNTADTVAIAATSSSGARSDLVVIQIEDPWVSGEPWQDPSDPTVGPYVFTRVISNVPAGTTDLNNVSGYSGRTAITLARIDIPASTGTITSSMITDLRSVANPRSDRQIVSSNPTDYTLTLNTATWGAFPNKSLTGIQVPTWATHAVIRAETAIKYVSGDAYANFQGFIGPAGQQDSTTLYTDLVIDSTAIGAGAAYRQPFIMPSNGYWPVPAALKGTTVQLSGRARAINASGGKVGTGAQDYWFADITFLERAV